AAPCLLLGPTRRALVGGGPPAGVSDLWRCFWTCLCNRAYRTLLVTFLVMNLGAGIGQATAVYALVYWLGFAQGEIGLLMPVYLGASCLALAFWTWLSGWLGKDVALKGVIFYESLVRFAAYFLVPSRPAVYAFMVATGCGFAGFVLVPSLLSDILDVDELDTGAQRAGVCLSFWTLILKGGTVIGPVLVGWILALAGYVPNVPQTPLVIETMRWLYGPIPGLFFFAGFFVSRTSSLPRERLGEIQAELTRRRPPAAAGGGVK